MAAAPALALPITPLCRYAAGRPAAPGDDAELLAYLRWLEARLNAWRCERLQCAASGLADAPAAPSLAVFARGFAVWLQRHPEHANEPLEWVVGSALEELVAGEHR